MTGDDPLGADNDTDAIKESFGRLLVSLNKVTATFEQLGESLYADPDFPADAAGNVAGSESG